MGALLLDTSALAGDLLTSEWSGRCPSVLWQWLASALAHCFMAAALAAFAPVRWAWAALGLWLAKELAFDLPAGGWAAAVALDSLADLSLAAIAYAAFRTRRGRQ